MTDNTDSIPQEYLDEAVRRLNDRLKGWFKADDLATKVLARTLQELGWKPPIDPMLVRARELAVRSIGTDYPLTVKRFRTGLNDSDPAVQAALIALREGMGE